MGPIRRPSSQGYTRQTMLLEKHGSETPLVKNGNCVFDVVFVSCLPLSTLFLVLNGLPVLGDNVLGNLCSSLASRSPILHSFDQLGGI